MCPPPLPGRGPAATVLWPGGHREKPTAGKYVIFWVLNVGQVAALLIAHCCAVQHTAELCSTLASRTARTPQLMHSRTNQHNFININLQRNAWVCNDPEDSDNHAMKAGYRHARFSGARSKTHLAADEIVIVQVGLVLGDTLTCGKPSWRGWYGSSLPRHEAQAQVWGSPTAGCHPRTI